MVVTLAVTAEPLIGSMVGWWAGVSRPPGARTFLGGAILIASTMFVVRAEEIRKAGAPPLAVITEHAGDASTAAVATAVDGEACAPAAEVQMQRSGASGERAADGAA